MAEMRSMASLYSQDSGGSRRTSYAPLGSGSNADGSLASTLNSGEPRSGWSSMQSVNSAFASLDSRRKSLLGEDVNDSDEDTVKSPEDASAALYRAFTSFEEQRPTSFGVLSVRIKSAAFSTTTLSQFPQQSHHSLTRTRKKPPDRSKHSRHSRFSIPSIANIASSPDLLLSQPYLTSMGTISDDRTSRRPSVGSIGSTGTLPVQSVPSSLNWTKSASKSPISEHLHTTPSHTAALSRSNQSHSLKTPPNPPNPPSSPPANPSSAFAMLHVRNLVRRTHVHAAYPPDRGPGGEGSTALHGTGIGNSNDSIVFWNETKHCPVAVPRDPRHPYGLVRVQVWVVEGTGGGRGDGGLADGTRSHPRGGQGDVGIGTCNGEVKLVGEVAFHLHDIVKATPIAGVYDLHHPMSSLSGSGLDSDPAIVGLAGVRLGDVDLEVTWNYGMFGYGHSWQIDDSAIHPTGTTRLPSSVNAVTTSLFPRIIPRAENAETDHVTVAAVRAEPHPPFVAPTGPQITPAAYRDEKSWQHEKDKKRRDAEASESTWRAPSARVLSSPQAPPLELDPTLFPIIMPGLGRANLSYGRYARPTLIDDLGTPQFRDETSVGSLVGAKRRWQKARRWKADTDRWKRTTGLWRVVTTDGEVVGTEFLNAAGANDDADENLESLLHSEVERLISSGGNHDETFHVTVKGIAEAVPPMQSGSPLVVDSKVRVHFDLGSPDNSRSPFNLDLWSDDEIDEGDHSDHRRTNDGRRKEIDTNSHGHSISSLASESSVAAKTWTMANGVLAFISRAGDALARGPGNAFSPWLEHPSLHNHSTGALPTPEIESSSNRNPMGRVVSHRPSSYTTFLIPVGGLPDLFKHPRDYDRDDRLLSMIKGTLMPPSPTLNATSPNLPNLIPNVNELVETGVESLNSLISRGWTVRALRFVKESGSDHRKVYPAEDRSMKDSKEGTPEIRVTQDDSPSLSLVRVEPTSTEGDTKIASPMDYEASSEMHSKFLPEDKLEIRQPVVRRVAELAGRSTRRKEATEAGRWADPSNSNKTESPKSIDAEVETARRITQPAVNESISSSAGTVPFIAVTSPSFDSAAIGSRGNLPYSMREKGEPSAEHRGPISEKSKSGGDYHSLFYPGGIGSSSGDVSPPVPAANTSKSFLSDEDISFLPYDVRQNARRRTGSNESFMDTEDPDLERTS
ncbi:hypothetical protein HDU93_002568 [Gonapodya sp. JEL0774]|nr:hypothetical protein HDU93_002568 [Gonapodya sp. JEL0774]